VKAVRVTFDNKDVITTNISGTRKEILEYYGVGRVFNLGRGEHDLMAKVVKCRFISPEFN